MPYIKSDEREYYQRGLIEVMVKKPNPGHLNYVLSSVCADYLGNEPTYSDFNEVIGVLECCKLELYRRLVAPYEDEKHDENGDVY